MTYFTFTEQKQNGESHVNFDAKAALTDGVIPQYHASMLPKSGVLSFYVQDNGDGTFGCDTENDDVANSIEQAREIVIAAVRAEYKMAV